MSKKLTLIILSCTIIFLIGTVQTFGQEEATNLKDKKITLNLERKPLEVVFYYLNFKYDVPIGMEGSTLDNDHLDYLFRTNLLKLSGDGSTYIDSTFVVKKHWFTINVKDAALEDVLNDIVGQMENYKWEINDGVVNIIPLKGRDERYEKLLDLQIDNFIFEKDLPVGLIRKNIFALPEVKMFLAENNIYSTDSRPYIANILRKIPDGMNFSKLTFRELLNKITKVKKGGWYLRKNFLYTTKEKEFIEIDI